MGRLGEVWLACKWFADGYPACGKRRGTQDDGGVRERKDRKYAIDEERDAS
jgi:hypothetical protein